jgi:hypothetical protein
MQQRQLRLGDILDDYCPRERRVTNHAVVAMVGQDVKQTRCTTCDAEHEYKHAKIPRQRRKNETAAAVSQVLAGAPKRVSHEPPAAPANAAVERFDDVPDEQPAVPVASVTAPSPPIDDFDDASVLAAAGGDDDGGDPERGGEHEGPVHRPLIRATLPRPAGQTPERPIPEFTMRQPAGRPNRFRPRHGRGGVQAFGHAGGGNTARGGARPHGAHPGGHANRPRTGRKRSK